MKPQFLINFVPSYLLYCALYCEKGGKGKEESVETRKRALSEEESEAQKQQHEGVGGSP